MARRVPEHVASSAQLPPTPLVPDDAHRPLGTLHLTLGVMNLSTKERLEKAIEFLQTLDIESILRNAEEQSASSPAAIGLEETKTPQPMTISLTSLSALPSARSATILHAEPIDATSRLYPFSVSLRNKFIEAGFMQCEMVKDTQKDTDDVNAIDNAIPAIKIPPGKKPRPLLLHATVANTIYAGKRRQRDSGKKDVYKFDATELLIKFGGYIPTPKEGAETGTQRRTARSYSSEIEEEEKEYQRQQLLEQAKPPSPFVWAHNIPLDRLCLCEMGAKRVPSDASKEGPALGAEYVVVSERNIDFTCEGRVD